MKRTFLALVVSLILSPSPSFADEHASFEKSWDGIEIPFDTYLQEIDDYQCYLNEHRFMGCMRFIESLACALDRHSRIYVSYDATPAAGEEKIESWGPLMWSKAQDTYVCSRSIKGRERFDLNIQFYQALKKSPDVKNIPFEAIIKTFQKRLESMPGKSRLSASAYQQFLTWAFDPHTVLMPKKYLEASAPNLAPTEPGKKPSDQKPRDASVETMVTKTPSGLILAHMKITSFIESGICQKVSNLLSQLTALKTHALILDVRGNPGGNIAEGVCIASLFIGQANVVGARPVYHGVVNADKPIEMLHGLNEVRTTIPLTLLINESSASMSEVLAAALQDHRRAWIVGRRSFGKGTGQSIKPFVPGVELLDTEFVLYSPNRWSHQGIGVPPDFEVPHVRGNAIVNHPPLEAVLYPYALEVPLDSDVAAIPLAGPDYPRGWKQQRPARKSLLQSCIDQKLALVKNWSAVTDYTLTYASAVLICEIENP